MSSSLFNQPNQNQQQIEMIKNLLQKNGMSAEQMVRNICKERNINLDELLRQMK